MNSDLEKYNSKFRLVFKNSNDSDLLNISELYEWRYCQNLPKVDTLVLKFGYENTVKNFNFEYLYDIFSKDKILKNIHVEMSLFANIFEDCSFYINQYENFKLNIKKINPNFECTIAWLYDFNLGNTDICLKNSKILKNNLYLHNFNNENILFDILINLHKEFKGIDITGYLNNINNKSVNNNKSIFNVINRLNQQNHKQLIGNIFPEYLDNSFFKENNLDDDLIQFCRDGYKIENNLITPLFYGSFDNFSILSSIDIKSFLLNDFNENLLFWKKELTKTISKSYCFTCENFEKCKNKKYFYQNLDFKQCSLGILENE